uniref:PDZ domain-containing protein n=1 Tax=Pyrodinium bahamense TaxID=73915 RepID=A0A7R9ZVX2_9DINO|mmetsp:Transcript_11971/g.32874  ORF Transcript_11971/g.32874 Transcript_11971/m.32874 type:complete len:146 (+) Transcript_11971:140-577(+)
MGNAPCCKPESTEGLTRQDLVVDVISSLPQNYSAKTAQQRNGFLDAIDMTGSLGLSKEVQIVREGPHWRAIGLIIAPDDNPNCLLIEEVMEPSLISEYNKKQADDFSRVRKGDKIVSLNGADTVDTMLRVIQASHKGSVLNFQMR